MRLLKELSKIRKFGFANCTNSGDVGFSLCKIARLSEQEIPASWRFPLLAPRSIRKTASISKCDLNHKIG